MKTLVLDCMAGGQATRILAALLDAGAEEATLYAAVSGLDWASSLRLSIRRSPSAGLMGTSVSLRTSDETVDNAPGYGYEHDHDWDAPQEGPLTAPVWGQLHEHDQLIRGLLPEWYAGFTVEEALEKVRAVSMRESCRMRVETMLRGLAVMRQSQPSGEIKRHELLVMICVALALESLAVQRVYTTPVCVGGDPLSRVILKVIADGVRDLPGCFEEGCRIGYGHDGRETAVPEVLRACVGEMRGE